MARRAQPTVRRYREALAAIYAQLNEADRRALTAHAWASGHDLSVEELARAAGAGSLQWTYGEYSRVARLLAKQLGPKKRDLDVVTRAIGDDYREVASGEVHWKMHRNLAAAVKKMPWGRDPKAKGAWGIEREHVLSALRDLDGGTEHRFHESTKYDLLHVGRRYPPKAVYGLAAKYAAGVELGPEDFSAGIQSTCFRTFQRLGFEIVRKRTMTSEDPQGDAEEERIEQRTDIGATRKLQLVNARRGQGIFRRNLEKIENRCRVTGIGDGRHLRASHIKPWAKADDREKLDGYNGLLLAPHVDHLFDQGYISFGDDGTMLVSMSLDLEVLDRWGIDPTRNYGPFKSKHRTYLEYHRTEQFRR